MPRIESFERNADRYEAWFEHHRLAYESELKAIRMLLPQNGEGLEVGVGTGRFAAPLGIGVGVEPSPAMGQLARERGIEVRFGVGENLPCDDKSFDFVRRLLLFGVSNRNQSVYDLGIEQRLKLAYLLSKWIPYPLSQVTLKYLPSKY